MAKDNGPHKMARPEGLPKPLAQKEPAIPAKEIVRLPEPKIIRGRFKG